MLSAYCSRTWAVQPAIRAAAKNRCHQVRRDAEHVEHRGRVEVHVRVQALLLERGLLDRLGDLVELRLRRDRTPRESRFSTSCEVVRLVDGVTESEDLLVALETVAYASAFSGLPTSSKLFIASSLAPPRASLSVPSRRDRGEHVGQCGCHDPRRERGRVHRVVGVEHERRIEHPDVLGRAPRRAASRKSAACPSAGFRLISIPVRSRW